MIRRSRLGIHRLLALFGMMAVAVVLTACDDSTSPDPPPAEEDPTIAEIVAADGQFSTLLGIVQAAGLVEALDDENATFTVFAPVNAAFAPYNVDVLAADEAVLGDVLQYHVIEGAAVESSDLSDGQTVTTLAGDDLLVRIIDGNVFIDGSQVTTPDVMAENGVVHVIDRVMVGNQNLATVASAVNATSSLFDVVVDAGLGEAFAGADGWTVFAPNNAAFAAVEGVLGELSEEQVVEILQYHVLPDAVTNSSELLALLAENDGEVSVPTATGEEVVITQAGDGSISFNGGQASLDLSNLDYFASNGIIHLIDGVLLPEAYRPAQTIASVVAGDSDFSTLLAALEAANLVEPLADEEATFTVFAPNNAAFGDINVDVLLGQPEALASVLGFHVIPDAALEAGDLTDGATVTTLAGDELTVSVDGEGNVSIGGSNVIAADIGTDNGVIHVIDRTLLGNQNLANVAWFVTETASLYGAVVDFGLADAFIGAENWTVFGPDNATFDEADLSPFSEEEIQAVLQYHVIAGDAPIHSADLLALLEANDGEISVETLQGEELIIALDNGAVVLNGGQATLNLELLDFNASNGVLHVIEGLILPPSLTD
jgi:transforming growth factor-beta-induced protein